MLNSKARMTWKLINSSFKLSAIEINVFIVLISLIKWGDEPAKKYFINLAALIKALQLDPNNYYTQFKNALETLQKQIIELQEDATKKRKHHTVALIEEVKWGEKEAEVMIKFPEALHEHLFNLKNAYKPIQVSSILSLKSKYAKRAYMHLMTWELDGKPKYWNIEDLRKQLGLLDFKQLDKDVKANKDRVIAAIIAKKDTKLQDGTIIKAGEVIKPERVIKKGTILKRAGTILTDSKGNPKREYDNFANLKENILDRIIDELALTDRPVDKIVPDKWQGKKVIRVKILMKEPGINTGLSALPGWDPSEGGGGVVGRDSNSQNPDTQGLTTYEHTVYYRTFTIGDYEYRQNFTLDEFLAFNAELPYFEDYQHYLAFNIYTVDQGFFMSFTKEQFEAWHKKQDDTVKTRFRDFNYYREYQKLYALKPLPKLIQEKINNKRAQKDTEFVAAEMRRFKLNEDSVDKLLLDYQPGVLYEVVKKIKSYVFNPRKEKILNPAGYAMTIFTNELKLPKDYFKKIDVLKAA